MSYIEQMVISIADFSSSQPRFEGAEVQIQQIVFVVTVFGYGLYQTTNNQLLEQCDKNDIDASDVFPANDKFVEADLYKGGIFLGCTFGAASLYIWAIGILAAGQSSTMTGTYAGQFAMEGFLNLKWARWKRVLFTRTIAIIPTFCTAFFSDIEDLTGMNDVLNAVMSLQLPFAVIPTIAFTSNKNIMGEFVNGIVIKIVTLLLAIVIIGINIYFVSSTITELELSAGPLVGVAIGGTLYLLLCLYLTIHLIASISETVAQKPLIKKYFFIEHDRQLSLDL
ncbi:protein Malvolio-like [Atheta coriaria]|uniref:protein Malvolio-like n=1 Tax=Dalotia coriaria TaxID=877792 RepID=UPI0031F37CB7